MSEQPMKTQTADELVMELLNKVAEKKKQIGSAERPAWKTNCAYGPDANSNHRVNIQTIREVNVLVALFATLQAAYKSYAQACEELGVKYTDAPFSHLGYTYAEWAADFRTQLDRLMIKNKRDELAKLEDRINALVSPEQRREMELKKLVEELK